MAVCEGPMVRALDRASDQQTVRTRADHRGESPVDVGRSGECSIPRYGSWEDTEHVRDQVMFTAMLPWQIASRPSLMRWGLCSQVSSCAQHEHTAAVSAQHGHTATVALQVVLAESLCVQEQCFETNFCRSCVQSYFGAGRVSP